MSRYSRVAASIDDDRMGGGGRDASGGGGRVGTRTSSSCWGMA
jgi:hypothetical protein